ncbi:MAG: hypothetical protein PWQ88_60 [Candidatus Methanomethylophilaceae archaeon]|nr:hypothetical protein [Candidatus Methanomethylophilaceae archaeon]MDI3541799.1 hypothetical protein [Candidatus Methanomethylophilaceae archaeon]
MIGIVIHGPEPVDSGYFQKIESLLPTVERIVMAGTTGATAVIDAGLQDKVEILRYECISDAVADLMFEYEAVVIVNQGKTMEGSLHLASVVSSRIPSERGGVVLFDNGFFAVLREGGEELWSPAASKLALSPKTVPPVEKSSVRVIHGVIPGESIWVNGNVIGRAVKPNPRIWKENDVLHFDGIEIRESALAHVGDFNPLEVKIRSGKVRRTPFTPRAISLSGCKDIIMVDHDAERCLRQCSGAALAVTVGDDTTHVAGALLYRFSVPIIGIVDGDEDGICDEKTIMPRSVIIRVAPGTDDIVGNKVRAEIFGGKERIDEGIPDEIVIKVMEIAEPYLISVKQW